MSIQTEKPESSPFARLVAKFKNPTQRVSQALSSAGAAKPADYAQSPIGRLAARFRKRASELQKS